MTARLRAAALWSLPLLLLVFLHNVLQTEAVRLIPKAALLENSGLTLADYLRADKTASACGYVTTHAELALPGSGKTLPVRVVYTDTRYAGLTGLRVQNGAFLPDGANRAMVIGDNLASDWFLTADILGVELTVGGQTYAVCGVYREEGSLAARLSQTGLAEVYLPLSALPDRKARLEGLFLPLENGEFLTQAADKAARLYDSYLWTYAQTDYREARLLAEQSGRVVWFLLGVPMVFLLARVFFRRFPGLCRDVTHLRRGYDRVPRARLWELLREGGLCLLLLLGIALVVYWVTFDLYLPPDWVMDSYGSVRFFERFPARFVDRFIAETQKLNASGFSFGGAYARRALVWLYGLDLVIAIVGLFWARAVGRVWDRER